MEMKQVFLASFCWCMVIVAATATVCYECINAKSDEECMLQGTASPCRSNQESCQTVIRYLGQQRLITKQCKQRKACINNLNQNEAVCKPNVADSFCYCCCHDDKCNANSDECWGEAKEVKPVIRKDSPEKPTKAECEDMEEPSIAVPITTCTDGNSADSICAMNEAEKIIMIQPVRRKCRKLPDGSYVWDEVTLALLQDEDVTCPAAEEPTENSDIACSGENFIGSRCMYQCKSGYVLEDMSTDQVVAPDRAVIDCVMDKEFGLVWNGGAPECKALACDASLLPPNDIIDLSCSDGSNLGSVCHFECARGFGLNPATSSSVACIPTGPASVQWDREIPQCEPLSCDPYVVDGAIVTCTDEMRVNSTCEVTCKDDGHVVFPSTFDSVTCLHDQTWTGNDAPCCRKPCPPNVPMDMVVAMDSSSSITRRTWARMQSFVKRLVKEFTVGPESTNFAIFRYNNKPDNDSHIPFDAGHDEATLLEAIDRIPKNGKGTWTGLALQFAAQVSLAPSSGNREKKPDMVVVITDGQNSRDDDVPASIQHLKDMDATVMVVSVKPARRLAGKPRKTEHLTDVAAGIEANVFYPSSKGTLDVIEDIKVVVTEKICGNICQM